MPILTNAVSEYDMVRILKFVLSRADSASLRKFASKVTRANNAEKAKDPTPKGEKKKRSRRRRSKKSRDALRLLLEFTAMQHFAKLIVSRPFSAHFMRHAMGSLSQQEYFVLAKIIAELVLKKRPSVVGRHVVLGTPMKPSIGQLLEFMSIILDSNFSRLTSLAGDSRDRDRYVVLRQQLGKLMDAVQSEIDFISGLNKLKQLVSGLKALKDTPAHDNDSSEYSIETILIENVLL